SLEVTERILDRARPLEAQVAVAGCDGLARERMGIDSRTVHVELLGPKSVGTRAVPAIDEFGADHISVETIRTVPFGHVGRALVELSVGSGHPRVSRSPSRVGAAAACPRVGASSLRRIADTW